MPALAIDDAYAQEIDDAVSVDGDWMYVHIADPSRLVLPGGALDEEAARRGSTLYLPESTLPLFPLSLGEGPLSLTQDNESNYAVTFAVRFPPYYSTSSLFVPIQRRAWPVPSAPPRD